MPLRTISCFTYRTSIDSPWTDAHHSVNQFVDALKERPVRGYGHVLVNGTLPKRRIDSTNANLARQWFGEMAAKILEDQQEAGPFVLVPIPECTCTVGVDRARAAGLAEAMAERSSKVHSVADVLRWDQAMPSASLEQGPRDPYELYPHLRLVGRINSRLPNVLIDDVLTTGGHLRACAAFLRDHGASVMLAICGARSDSVPQEDPFQLRVDELDDFVWNAG